MASLVRSNIKLREQDISRGLGVSLAIFLVVAIMLLLFYPPSTPIQLLGTILAWIAFIGFHIYAFLRNRPARHNVNIDYDPLNLQAGSIRFFLLALVAIVFGYYLIAIPNIISSPLFPTIGSLIVILNIVLIYYGFKPQEFLPKEFVSQNVPDKPLSNYYLIENVPGLRNIFDAVEQDVDTCCQEVIEKIDGASQILVTGQNVATTFIADTRDAITNPIEDASNRFFNTLLKFPETKPNQGIFDRWNYFILLVIIVIINLFYQPSLSTEVNVVSSAIIVGVGVVAGKVIDRAFFDGILRNVQKPIKQLLQRLREKANLLVDIVNSAGNALDQFLGALKTAVGNFQKDIKQKIQEFKQSTFLDYLPTDLAALVSLCAMALGCVTILALPIDWAWVPTVLVGMEFIVSYYFTSKKT